MGIRCVLSALQSSRSAGIAGACNADFALEAMPCTCLRFRELKRVAAAGAVVPITRPRCSRVSCLSAVQV